MTSLKLLLTALCYSAGLGSGVVAKPTRTSSLTAITPESAIAILTSGIYRLQTSGVDEGVYWFRLDGTFSVQGDIVIGEGRWNVRDKELCMLESSDYQPCMKVFLEKGKPGRVVGIRLEDGAKLTFDRMMR